MCSKLGLQVSCIKREEYPTKNSDAHKDMCNCHQRHSHHNCIQVKNAKLSRQEVSSHRSFYLDALACIKSFPIASATAVQAVGELDKRKALTCNAADTVGTIFVEDTRVINCTPAMTVIFRKQWPNVQVTPTTAAAVARLKRNYFECRTRILGNVPTRVGKRDQVDR